MGRDIFTIRNSSIPSLIIATRDASTPPLASAFAQLIEFTSVTEIPALGFRFFQGRQIVTSKYGQRNLNFSIYPKFEITAE